MTTENWINVAMIIAVIMTAAATLLGPVLAAYVQVRMSQPKPTPTDSQAKPARRESRLRRFVFSRAVAYVGIVLTASAFVWLSFLPVARMNVASMCFVTFSLTYQFASLSDWNLRDTIDRHVDLTESHQRLILALAEAVIVQSDTRDSAETKALLEFLRIALQNKDLIRDRPS
jgi:hypothetical protein